MASPIWGEIVEDIKVLKKFAKRVSNLHQFRIGFNFQLKGIVSKIRGTLQSQSLTPSEKIELCLQVLPELQELFNFIPSANLQQWMDLSDATNMVLLNLVSFGRMFESSRLVASAHILARLLIGVPDMAEFVQTNPDIPPDKIRNALILTAGVFVEVIVSLHEINESDFVVWANRAYVHFGQYWNFLEKGTYRTHLTSLNDSERLIGYRQFIIPIWNMLGFSFNLFRIFGHSFPPQINTQGLFSPSLHGVIEFAKTCRTIFQKTLSQIDNEISIGMLPRNLTETQLEHIRRIEFIEKLTGVYIAHVETLKGIDTALVHSPSVEFTERVSNLATHVLSIKDELDRKLGYPENAFLTPYFSIYVDLIDLLLDYSIFTPLPKHVANMIISFKHEVPLLYYKLFTIERLKKHSEYDFDLDFLLESMKFRSREMLEIMVLADNINADQLFQDLSSSPSFQKLAKELVDYYSGDGEYPEQMIELNPLDFRTWFYGSVLPSGKKYFPISASKFKVVSDQ